MGVEPKTSPLLELGNVAADNDYIGASDPQPKLGVSARDATELHRDLHTPSVLCPPTTSGRHRLTTGGNRKQWQTQVGGNLHCRASRQRPLRPEGRYREEGVGTAPR